MIEMGFHLIEKGEETFSYRHFGAGNRPALPAEGHIAFNKQTWASLEENSIFIDSKDPISFDFNIAVDKNSVSCDGK